MRTFYEPINNSTPAITHQEDLHSLSETEGKNPIESTRQRPGIADGYVRKGDG
jgi:hypothetical protein